MFKHHSHRLAIAALAAFTGTLLLIACATTTAEGGQLPGALVWQNNCGNCHNFRSPADYSDREWEAVVLHMRVRANLSADDARAIETFLKSSN